jgi:glycosyltransferase involved in cell wall biosynthesis
MRVGLNALHLVPGETGGSEIYARRLVPALLEADPGFQLTLFVGREAARDSWPDAVEVVTLPVHARSRPRRVLAEQTVLPLAVARAKVDLLHNLFTTAPALPTVPQVTTILDVIYKRFPETHAGALSYGMRVLVPLAARRSRRVITLSEAAKQDIVRFLAVSPDRVDVAYLGPGLRQHVEPVPEAELRRRLDLGDAPLVLTVSAKRPHKNLGRLIEAVARVDAPSPVLVIPGYPTPFERDLELRADATAPRRVRFTGWVDDATLAGLYRAAAGFVFPSLAEGFGLPVLDALARGVPVACSNTTSLPEVAGDAALYFDPLDVAQIADAVKRILRDEPLRERLWQAGPKQAARFSWEATATATLASYRRALAARS